MATSPIEDRFRGGTKYWKFGCEGKGITAAQVGLANLVDGGTWRLDPVDFSTGDAKYVEWGAGKMTYDDLHVTFLQNNQTKTFRDLAQAIATGQNNSANRFHCTLTFIDDAKATQMQIDYIDCQIVSHSTNGFDSQSTSEAATETVVFRPSYGTIQ